MDSGNDETVEAFEADVVATVDTGKSLSAADDVSYVDDSQDVDDVITDMSSDAADEPHFEWICSGKSLIAPCPVVVPSPTSCTRVIPSGGPVWSDYASPLSGELDPFHSEWWPGVGETEPSNIDFRQHVEGEGSANVDLERSSADYDLV